MPLCRLILLGLVLGFFGSAVSSQAVEPLRFGETRIRIVDIYGEDELKESAGLVNLAHRTMNTLHSGTRHRIISNELLFRTGDPFETDLLAETERNLRSLGFLNHVTITPLDTLADGTVPIEVSVQETWTLSTQFSYSRSSSSDRWTALISDNNFLGYGVHLEAGLGQDEDRDWRSLYFQNRRVMGTGWLVRARTTDLSDGHTHEVGLEHPFYALDDPWGVTALGWDLSFRPRYYLSPFALDQTTNGNDRLYMTPTLRREGLFAQALYRASPRNRGRIWRVGAGLWTEMLNYGLPDQVALSDDRIISRDEAQSAAGEPFHRESGRLVQPYLRIESQGRTWATDRFVLRYGADEDISLEPSFFLKMGPALTVLGSDRERWLYEAGLLDWSRLGPGWLMTWVEARGSFSTPDKAWRHGGLTLGWFSHLLGGMSRIIFETAAADDPPGTEALSLGLTRGLRTLEYDGMVGDRLVRWNVEQAVLYPDEIMGFWRAGLAAFYAGGAAWWDGGSRGLDDARHELGFGLRFGPTRSARTEIGRLDLAWPLDGSSGPTLTAKTGGFF